MMRRILLVTLALSAAVATACSSDDQAAENGPLPNAAGLLKDAAASMAEVRSAHFTLNVNGEIPGLSVQKADGDLTRENGESGAAKGTVSMMALGSLFEGEFVLVDDSLYIEGATGGWQKLPASFARDLYDPAAILDPERGIAKVLASVQNPATEGSEDIDGVSTYRVGGRVTKDVVAALVPGIDSDVDIVFWLRQDDGHQPVKARVLVRAEGDPTVDVTLSDVNKQVSITAPQ
jgi:lipoprotein LprG